MATSLVPVKARLKRWKSILKVFFRGGIFLIKRAVIIKSDERITATVTVIPAQRGKYF